METPTPKDVQVRAGDKLGRDFAAFNEAKREVPSTTEQLIESDPEATRRLLWAIFSYEPEAEDIIESLVADEPRVEVKTPKREFVLQPQLTQRPFVTPELMELKRNLRRKK